MSKIDGYTISRWIWEYLPNTGAKPIDYAVAFYISHLYNLKRSKGYISLFSEEISQNLCVDTRAVIKSLKRLENASYIKVSSKAINQFKPMQVEIMLGIPSLPIHEPIQKMQEHMQEQIEEPIQVLKHEPIQKMQGHSLYNSKYLNTQNNYDDNKGSKVDFFEMFLDDMRYREIYCMSYSIDLGDYTDLQQEFINHAKVQAQDYHQYKDLIKHFDNYARKIRQINKNFNKKSQISKANLALEILQNKK